MAKLRQVGKQDYFEKYWPHLNTQAWPGREFKFMYCHPIITALIFFAVISEIIIFIWIRKVPFS